MPSEEKRILAIDFGLKRIGLALSDPLMIFAYPYKTITNDKNTLNELRQIINEKNVAEIILGFPFSETRSRTSVKDDILRFKETIEKKFMINVQLFDETYTSSIARENVIKTVTKKSKRKDKGLLDMNSAAIILQEYLDNLKEEKGNIN